MKMAVAGTFHGLENVAVGDVVDVPGEEGARYCGLGYAEPVTEDKTENAKMDDASDKRRGGRSRKAGE